MRTGSPRERAPELERLLEGAAEPDLVHDWRADAQRLLFGPNAGTLSIAPVLCFKHRELSAAPPAAHVFLVSALHARASLTSVGLPSNGLLRLTAEEARVLAEDFNRVFASGIKAQRPDSVRLAAGADGHLFCLFATALNAQTIDPAMAMGHDLWDFRVRGDDAARLARLSTEMEMWLFGHALNLQRRAAGKLEINAMWLWGGGPVLAHMPPATFEFLGEDPLFSTWSTFGGTPAPGAGRIIVCNASPGEPAFIAQAQAAIGEAAKALRRGTLGALYVSAGRRCLAVRRMPRRIFFRRSKPWWEHFDDAD